MLKKLSLFVLVLSFAVLGFAKEDPGFASFNMFEAYDLAPGAIPGATVPSDPMWDVQYTWLAETITGDNGCLGIAFDGTHIWVSGRGVPTTDHKLYVIDPYTGALLNTISTGTGGSWGLRDLEFDGTYIVGGVENIVQFWDPVSMTLVTTINSPQGANFPRALGYDASTDHFFSGNFAQTCYEFTRQGATVRTFSPTPLGAIYGFTWEDDAPDGPWLWANDQTAPVSGCNMHRWDPATLTYTGFVITVNIPGCAAPVAGGCAYATGLDPEFSSMLVFGQGTPDGGSAFEMYLMADPLSPGAPTGFVVTSVQAMLDAFLSWTNPALTVSGVTLTDLDGVRVYRDGTQIANIFPVTIGGLEEYEDLVPAAGFYTWDLVPYNDHGDGLPASYTYYMGLDTPGPVTNLTATAGAMGALSANLAWTAPAAGAHGGYFAGCSSYNIYRAPAGGTFALIGTSTTTSYTDNAVPSAGGYLYRVTGVNAAGEGQPAQAPAIWIGVDVPAAPGNIVVTPGAAGALNATINWDAVTLGAHGGYITPITSYNVYRAQQGGVSALIGTSTTTSYFDNTVPHAGWYVYSVAGVNTGGEGNIGNAPVIFIGPAEWEPTTYNWFEISGIGTPIPFTADDQNLGPYPIGMTFPYYNAAFFSTFRACTNGFISFTSTSTVYTNAAIPTAAEPNNLISPYWDDLTFSSTGDAYYYYDAANTRCIIEYLHAPHLSYAASDFTFQIILEENGDIIYQYMIVDPSTMTPFPSATVGIENAAGTVGIQCTYNGSGPWEPTANTAVIIYSVGISEPPDVSVVLTPVGLPIVIPPTGGAFNFNISVTNNEPTGTVCGVWTMITIPAGATVGPFINAPAINFVTPGQNINRDRAQSIPAAAPAGNYVYHAYTGFYPAMIGDEDSFPFSKSADGDGGIPVKDWYCWGEAFPGETGVFAAPDLPSSYVLSDAYPNPFNPITHIGYSLPQRAYVELTVFDVTGRQVTTLVKGWMDAGSHEATFYAQGLASGVYFYRLTAGDFSSVKKMILMK